MEKASYLFIFCFATIVLFYIPLCRLIVCQLKVNQYEMMGKWKSMEKICYFCLKTNKSRTFLLALQRILQWRIFALGTKKFFLRKQTILNCRTKNTLLENLMEAQFLYFFNSYQYHMRFNPLENPHHANK